MNCSLIPHACGPAFFRFDSIGRQIKRTPPVCLLLARVTVEASGCWSYSGSHNNMGYAKVRRRSTAGAKSTARAEARTHCGQGHEWTLENTRIGPKQRSCRACARISNWRRRGLPKGASA